MRMIRNFKENDMYNTGEEISDISLDYFIVINEDQQITPIYRDVSMIPKPLREF